MYMKTLESKIPRINGGFFRSGKLFGGFGGVDDGFESLGLTDS